MLSPDLAIRGVAKNWKPEKWATFEVENFTMSVKNQARTALGIGKKDLFIGPVLVSFYMHVKDPNSSGLILLKKDITYVDVPLTKPTNFSVYLSPVTIANLTGGSGAFRAERYGYEVKYGQDVIYRWSSDPSKNDWWNIATTSVTRDEGKYPLLNKDETPFAMLWHDRYPSIKKIDSTALGNTIKEINTSLEEANETDTPATDEKKPATSNKPATNTNRANRNTGGTSPSSRTMPGGTPGF